MAYYRRKIADPPSSLSGPLRSYLQSLADYVNSVPTLSYFSGSSPSGITGLAGDLAFNVGSASTSSRLWQNVGTSQNTSNWVLVRVLQ